MKKTIFLLFTLLLVAVLPALAQDTTEPAWLGTVSMISTAVLMIVSLTLGVKYTSAKKAAGEGADKIGLAAGTLGDLFFEIKVLMQMVPASLEDDKLSNEELLQATNQIKLIMIKLKGVLGFFKAKGIMPPD